MDKKAQDNEQFFKAYHWDGEELKQQFAIDFNKEKLRRPHQMRFGAESLYTGKKSVEKIYWHVRQLLCIDGLSIL